MNKKIIFFDVDGTLVDVRPAREYVPESTIKAVRETRKKGNLCFLCTGRSLAEIYPHILDVGFDGIIGAGGGFVTIGDEMLYHKKVSDNDVHRVVDFFEENDYDYYLESNGGLFASENLVSRLEKITYGDLENDENARKKKEEQPSHFITSLIEGESMYRSDVNKICFLENKDIPFQTINDHFSDAFNVIHCTVPAFGDDSGELSVVGVNKASAIETLIQHLNGLLEPTSGRILVDDIDITNKEAKLTEIRKKIGLVFQYPEYQLFEETIKKDIAFGPNNLELSSEEVSRRVKKSMEMVGLDYETYKNVSPFDLSGGQKRRVAIAGVIAMEPKVLILDEPTAGLDPQGRDDILEQIKLLHEKYKMTIVLVSHSMEDVGKLAQRIVVMNKGKVELLGKPSEVFKEVETLEKIGLAVPQVTYLMRVLRERGFDVSDEIFTVEKGTEAILKVLSK